MYQLSSAERRARRLVPPAWSVTVNAWFVLACRALYLGVLWLVACVPVVTVPAATTALFSALNDWRAAGRTPTAGSFVRSMRQCFFVSLALGFALLAAGLALRVDFAIIHAMSGAQANIMLACWSAVTATASMLSVFAFASLAAAEWPRLPAVLAVSARRAVAHPVHAAVGVLTCLGGAAAVTVLPVSVFAVAVTVAAVIERLFAAEVRARG